MKSSNIKKTLSEGLWGINIKTSKFKTARTAHLFCPADNRANTACASLLAKLICRSTADYNSPKALRERLNFLYGADLNASGHALRRQYDS